MEELLKRIELLEENHKILAEHLSVEMPKFVAEIEALQNEVRKLKEGR